MPLSVVLGLIDRWGVPCTLQRPSPTGNDPNVSGITMWEFRPQANDAPVLSGAVTQFDKKFSVKASALTVFAEVPRRGDVVVSSRGGIYTVKEVEDITVEAGAVGGYHLYARGH